MPRQPFLPEHQGKHFCFDGRGVATFHSMAALIGRTVCEWSRAEHSMAMVLAAMLGENPTAGVALFTALRNARAQRDAINAVADALLEGDRRILLSAVLSIYTASGKLRNDLAHGVIGWSFDMPSTLLWFASSDYAQYNAESWVRFTAPVADPKSQNHDMLERKIFFIKKMI